jgi:predicted phosphodiesterase
MQAMKVDQIIVDYILNHKEELINNTISKLGLAKKIVAENPSRYTSADIERIRRSIRGRLNANGKNNTATALFDAPVVDIGKLVKLGMHLPESKVEKREDFNIKGSQRVLIISDIHYPYYDRDALLCALGFGKEKEVDTIIINGDLIDFWQISSFSKIGTKMGAADEVQGAREFLYWLRREFPTCRIVYKFGNHEARWNKYIWSRGPELARLLEMEYGQNLGLPAMLHCEALKIEIVHEWQWIRLGKLTVIHGHEVAGRFGGSVTPARALMNKMKVSALHGHVHQVDTYTANNGKGEAINCYTTGALCNLDADYDGTAKLRCSHGFAFVQMTGDNFRVSNIRIINGEIY